MAKLSKDEIRRAVRAVTFNDEPSECDKAYARIVRVARDMDGDDPSQTPDNLRFLAEELLKIADVLEGGNEPA